MTITNFQIDPNQGFKAAGEVNEVTDWVDGKPSGQKRDETTGLPMYRVSLFMISRDRDGKEKSDQIQVQVPLKEEPDFPMFADLRVQGLRARVSFRGEKVYFSAENIELKAGGPK